LASSLPENFTCLTKDFEMWCARNFAKNCALLVVVKLPLLAA